MIYVAYNLCAGLNEQNRLLSLPDEEEMPLSLLLFLPAPAHEKRDIPTSMGNVPSLSYFLINCNDLSLIIRATCLAYSVRHHQLAAFAALY